MAGQLEDKVCIVTGAGSGIGRATAAAFAQEGAKVLCVDLNGASNEETARGIRAAGGDAQAHAADVSDYAAARGAVEACVARWGALDALCNIAGIGKLKFDAEETPELWARVIGVNLTGTFYMSQHALPHLLARKGAIVNCSSRAGTDGIPWGAAYSASKGGVVALTRSMAMTHAYEGLRVNCVAPGPVNTGIVPDFIPPSDGDMRLMSFLMPFQKVAAPEEVAWAFVFLASERAGYINGAILPVDGG
jgi:NAD(P)-dependent dehydrogenase (short-subunit alcohol dehydrogenase family)